MKIIKTTKKFGDVNKWSFIQACNDANGKSTFMSPAGTLLVLVGAIMSIIVTFTNHLEALPQFVFLAGLGSSVLVGRKIINGQPQLEDTPIDEEGQPIIPKPDQCEEG